MAGPVPWSIAESLDGRGPFGPVPARPREDSSVSGAHHPVPLLPSASPCLEALILEVSPFSLPGRKPAGVCSANAPRPPGIPPRCCAVSLAGTGTKGKKRKPGLVCFSRPGWRRWVGVLAAVGGGACGPGRGGSGCVSLLVSLARPSPGGPAHGLARRAVRVFRPGLSWFSLRALELKPGPGGGQAGADRGTGGVGISVVAHLGSGSAKGGPVLPRHPEGQLLY